MVEWVGVGGGLRRDDGGEVISVRHRLSVFALRTNTRHHSLPFSLSTPRIGPKAENKIVWTMILLVYLNRPIIVAKTSNHRLTVKLPLMEAPSDH